MNVQEQIDSYLESQPEPKRSEIKALHESIISQFSDWLIFRQGRSGEGAR